MIDLRQSIRELLIDCGIRSVESDLMANLILATYHALEMRVGERLTVGMSNKQINQFEVYLNEKDDQGALNWLQSNVPEYRSVVRVEHDELLAEMGHGLDSWRGLL